MTTGALMSDPAVVSMRVLRGLPLEINAVTQAAILSRQAIAKPQYRKVQKPQEIPSEREHQQNSPNAQNALHLGIPKDFDMFCFLARTLCVYHCLCGTRNRLNCSAEIQHQNIQHSF